MINNTEIRKIASMCVIFCYPIFQSSESRIQIIVNTATVIPRPMHKDLLPMNKLTKKAIKITP